MGAGLFATETPQYAETLQSERIYLDELADTLENGVVEIPVGALVVETTIRISHTTNSAFDQLRNITGGVAFVAPNAGRVSVGAVRAAKK